MQEKDRDGGGLRVDVGYVEISSSLLAATMTQKSSLRENRALSHRRWWRTLFPAPPAWLLARHKGAI